MSSITIASPIGPLGLTAAEGKLTGVAFVGRWSSTDPPAEVPPAAAGTDPVLARTQHQLTEYFDGTRTDFDLPLEPQGDQFHRDVWELIAEIPYGGTVSYGSIATRLGGIRLSQAVGSATGSNPLPLVIPCHRVIGADGALTGFGGGLDRKRFLLALEESDEVKAARLF